MTNPRSKKEELSATCTNYLNDVWVANKFGRVNDIDSKYLNKGREVEDQSITLLSKVNKTFYVKNEEKFEDDHFTGTPDIVKPQLRDIKSSWDIFTFFRSIRGDIDKSYYWQLQGYMALTGEKVAYLDYVLVDTPVDIVDREIDRTAWKHGLFGGASWLFDDMASDVRKKSYYSDIPEEQRLFTFTVERNDDDINMARERVEACRKYYNSL